MNNKLSEAEISEMYIARARLMMRDEKVKNSLTFTVTGVQQNCIRPLGAWVDVKMWVPAIDVPLIQSQTESEHSKSL